jgi:hypothetical protein
VDAILDHPCAELAGGFLGHHTVEDQLYAVRPSQIQIVADDFFEELPAPVCRQNQICGPARVGNDDWPVYR